MKLEEGQMCTWKLLNGESFIITKIKGFIVYIVYIDGSIHSHSDRFVEQNSTLGEI